MSSYGWKLHLFLWNVVANLGRSLLCFATMYQPLLTIFELCYTMASRVTDLISIPGHLVCVILVAGHFITWALFSHTCRRISPLFSHSLCSSKYIHLNMLKLSIIIKILPLPKMSLIWIVFKKKQTFQLWFCDERLFYESTLLWKKLTH